MNTAVRLHAAGPPTAEAHSDSILRCQDALELLLTHRGNPSVEVERVLADNPPRPAATSSVAGIGQLHRYEPVQGANNGGDERVATAVAGIVEDVKLTGSPPLRQLPRGFQRA